MTAPVVKFYLETSDRSMETHAVRMPPEGATENTWTPETACGHGLDASWEPFPEARAKAQPWPSCGICYKAVTKRGWMPHNVEEDK